MTGLQGSETGRIGFDPKIHPYQIQLRVCCFPDYQGIRSQDSETLDLQKGKIISYHTDSEQIGTTIREFVASDEDLTELYRFFTLDELKAFEAVPIDEHSSYERGYYDWADLRYLLIAADGRVSDGQRHRIYSNDPIQMAIEWMHKVTPSGFWD